MFEVNEEDKINKFKGYPKNSDLNAWKKFANFIGSVLNLGIRWVEAQVEVVEAKVLNEKSQAMSNVQDVKLKTIEQKKAEAQTLKIIADFNRLDEPLTEKELNDPAALDNSIEELEEYINFLKYKRNSHIDININNDEEES